MIGIKYFEATLEWIKPFLGDISLAMGMISLICLLVGCYCLLKKEKHGKYITLVGCLLMINPLIYFLTH